MAIDKAAKIWYNGEFVDWDECRVHILTHALHYGSGVFEGIRAYETSKGTAVFRLTDHMKRLHRSAKIYKMEIPYTVDELCEATLELIRVNELPNCYIRPIAFRGYGEMGLNPLKCPVDVAIAAWPWGAYLGEKGIKHGIRTKISSYRRPDPNAIPPAAKATGQYLNSQLAKMEALIAGYDEAILLNPEGYVADGAGENLFMIRAGKIYTTPTSAGALEGITRDSIIQIAENVGYEVIEKNLVRADLYLADELFFTGTAAEVVPIREIDDREIGEPGHITKTLQKIFFKCVHDAKEEYLTWLEFV